MNVSEGMEKTIMAKRGYSLGNFRTQYNETTEETTFILTHYGTEILKARKKGLRIVEKPCYETCDQIKGLNWQQRENLCKSCSAGTKEGYFKEEFEEDAWELVEWGGWSPSDRDRNNEALRMLGIENASFSRGEGGFMGSGRPLECWLNGVPVDHELNPIPDLKTLEKQIKSLKAIFNVEYGQYFGTTEGKLIINPKNSYSVLDIRNKNGFDALNGFNQNMAVVRIEDPESNPYTRFILEVDPKRLNVYNVNFKFHKTVKKCLEFITRKAHYRHGDLCFRKLQKLPESTKETHRARWRDEEAENTEIFTKGKDSYGYPIKWARVTHKLVEEARIDSVSEKKAWEWLRNENPHIFEGKNFSIYTLNRRQIVNAREDLTIRHVEHETLNLPKGIYEFYQVRGLETQRYGRD